ncbi:MAG: hypothetical protein LRZ97_02010 [Candidatus Pacebacteria bacterium]|nr:hypothetical protein [Candidatus Paceibacterota bacterium]
MVLRSRQKLWHKVALSWLTIIGLLFMSIILVRSVWDIYIKNQESTKRVNAAKMELVKLIERKEALTSNLELIKSSAGVEAELRGKFDVARDGEHLLVIIDKEVKIEKIKERHSMFGNLWRKWTQ